MHNSKNLLFLLFMSCITSLNAQTDASLEELLTTLSGAIGEVPVSKDTYKQSLTYDAKTPWSVKLAITMVDRKGREEQHEYFFNLADLDKHTIQIESGKDEQVVEMEIEGERDYIRYVEDGEDEEYTDELEIWATDIDNARKIEKTLEAIIVPAREAWEKAARVDGSGEDLKEWLVNKVGKVVVDEEQILQKVTFDEKIKDRLSIEVDNTDEGEKTTYSFSLADLNPRKVALEVKGGKLFIEGETNKGIDFIEVYEDGQLESFDDQFSFFVSDIDEGRQIVLVMDSLIRYGERELEKRLPNPGSLEEGLELLAAQVHSFSSEDTEMEQDLKAETVSRYILKETDIEDGDEETNEYAFSFGDMNDREVELDIKKDEVLVEINTKANNRYIQHIEDGEPQNFTSSFEIYAKSTENARMLKHLLEYVIDEAGEIPVEAKDWEWLKEAIANSSNDEVQQSIKVQEGESSNCKLNFTRINIDDDEEEEEIFEFNVYDLNAKDVEIDISGEEVGLELKTIGGEDIIKHYEDGDPDFTDDFTIRFDGMENVKVAKATMVKIIEGCKE